MKRPVYVIHGLGGIVPFISRGTRKIDDLIDALPPEAKGEISFEFLQNQGDQIITDIKKHLESGKVEVILIGHSKGVETATTVAEWCRKNGVKVIYLAAIDPTAGYVMPIGENVLRVDEFWSLDPFPINFPYLARKIPFAPGGRVSIPKGWPGKYKLFKVDCGHIESAEHPTTVDRIVKIVGRLVI